MSKVTVIDNVLTERSTFDLYTGLVSSTMWSLDRSSVGSDFRPFAGIVVKDEGQINSPYFSGYFTGILESVRCKFKEQEGYDLPPVIKRIHLGAKNDVSKTEFHPDINSATAYTVLGMLTPQWSPEWGGELNVRGEVIDFIPGRFLVFKSCDLHNGGGPDYPVPYWRITLNYILDQE